MSAVPHSGQNFAPASTGSRTTGTSAQRGAALAQNFAGSGDFWHAGQATALMWQIIGWWPWHDSARSRHGLARRNATGGSGSCMLTAPVSVFVWVRDDSKEAAGHARADHRARVPVRDLDLSLDQDGRQAVRRLRVRLAARRGRGDRRRPARRHPELLGPRRRRLPRQPGRRQRGVVPAGAPRHRARHCTLRARALPRLAGAAGDVRRGRLPERRLRPRRRRGGLPDDRRRLLAGAPRSS